jgi:putative transposase
MSIPPRLKNERPGTFFVSANALQQKHLLQSDRAARLFIDVLLSYRDAGKFLIHEFTVMPNHVHILVTTINGKLSDAMQLIKGGYSYRARKQFAGTGQVWQRSYSDHCVRNTDDYFAHRNYIWQNAVKAGLVQRAKDWPWCSANGKFRLDPVPENFRG